MIYLSYGLPRSGSSFCYQIIHDLLARYSVMNGLRLGNIRDILPGHPYELFFQPSDSSSLDALLEKALRMSDQKMCLAIKAHCGLTEYAKNLLENKKILANASFRHPGDCILSYMDAYRREKVEQKASRFPQGNNFERSLEVYEYHANTFLKWAHTRNVLLIYYDEIVGNPEIVVKRLKQQIGLDIDEAEVLKPYLADKTKILEFNKGKLNRRFQELSTHQIQEVEKKYETLISFIQHYSKTQDNTDID